MSHSFSNILVHAVWGTKDRQPFIFPEVEDNIYQMIKEEMGALGCPVLILNGMPDHIHLLFFLNPNKSIAEVIKQVKGTTSHSINQQDLVPYKFAWQTGYAVFSVSKSMQQKTYYYIRNQKSHHLKKSFEQEYEEFLKLYDADGPRF